MCMGGRPAQPGRANDDVGEPLGRSVFEFVREPRNDGGRRPIPGGMRGRKQSGTFGRGGSESTDPPDPRLAPGPLLVIGADDALRKACAASVRQALDLEAHSIGSFTVLTNLVHPRSTRPGGRPPISGLLIEWSLHGRRDLATPCVTSWLDAIYPCIPVVFYTAEPDFHAIQRACTAHGLEIARPLETSREDAVIRDALLGTIALCEAERPLFSFPGRGLEGYRYLNEQLFAPWADRRLQLRMWLLDHAECREKVQESLLRTVDAYLDLVPLDELGHARGVTASTLRSLLKEIRSTWGMGLPALLQSCERALRRPGLRPVRPLPWQAQE